MSDARLRILVAEDDAVSRMILQKYISKLGHEVLVACDGEEAWKVCQAQPADVLISDWQMPGLEGPELCRRLRAHESGSDHYTYVILLTSHEGRQHFLGGLQAGADDYLMKPLDRENLQARLISAARVTGLHQDLAAQKAELERLNTKLFHEGRTDSLTRLRNRLSMQEDLKSLHDQCRRYGHCFATALCDIDRYKLYNDRYGHLEGDNVLRRVASCLVDSCRVSDAVYRYGGEEFLVVLQEQDLASACLAMERVRQAVADLGITHEGSDSGIVTISVGVAAVHPHDLKSVDAGLRDADAALYLAKKSGRNRVAVFRMGDTGPVLAGV